MSADLEATSDEVCASCGKAALDDVKLKNCACELVKYCSDECRDEHRDQHDESHDKALFAHPDSCCYGECPICFLPMPHDGREATSYECCSKIVCNGCVYVYQEINGCNGCPFCRESLPKDVEEFDRRWMKRVKANDPTALSQMGTICYEQGDWKSAVKYWKRSTELGSVDAHYQLGTVYRKGHGVKKDKDKEVYHFEKAAIGGDPLARYYLARIERENLRTERAAKHFIIAANLGDEEAMEELRKYYSDGNISKEDLDATLLSHQAAIDAMKSEEREAALAFYGED